MAILTKGATFADGDQVTSANLNNLVDAAAFASGAVDDATTQLSGGKITVKTIQTANIANSAVTSDKIGTGSVIEAKIGAGAVTAAKLATDSVTETKIADNSVTNAKMADDSVDTAEIVDGAVTAAKLDGGQTGSLPIYGIRCYGRIEIGTSTRTIVAASSSNIATATKDDANRTDITFTTAMPDANYLVIGSYGVEDGLTVNFSVYDKTSSGFSVYHQNDLDGRYIEFIVIG